MAITDRHLGPVEAEPEQQPQPGRGRRAARKFSKVSLIVSVVTLVAVLGLMLALVVLTKSTDGTTALNSSGEQPGQAPLPSAPAVQPQDLAGVDLSPCPVTLATSVTSTQVIVETLVHIYDHAQALHNKDCFERYWASGERIRLELMEPPLEDGAPIEATVRVTDGPATLSSHDPVSVTYTYTQDGVVVHRYRAALVWSDGWLVDETEWL